jgi:hypothetical protein
MEDLEDWKQAYSYGLIPRKQHSVRFKNLLNESKAMQPSLPPATQGELSLWLVSKLQHRGVISHLTMEKTGKQTGNLSHTVKVSIMKNHVDSMYCWTGYNENVWECHFISAAFFPKH